MIVACAPASINLNDSWTMTGIDAVHLLACSLMALVAVTTIAWLLRRPSGRRSIAAGCTLSLVCMAVPAMVMAFAPLPATERVIGRASTVVPPAEPYREVPPPGRRGDVIVLEDAATAE